MSTKIDLTDLGGGAVGERFLYEMNKVLANIYDPNTDPKKVREVTLKIKLKGDENRDVLLTEIHATSKLAPTRPVETKIIMGLDNSGRVVGAELKSGVKDQMMIDNEGDVADDKGNKVVGFNKHTAQGGK
ncbi:replication terminator protein [Paenibacillus oleatilyticus]|uniref:Replication terminator protein n=1 Tax=Paenibacillus oleatilyticus TaxID=2594886 RepID=A0ABV4UVH6_9BACL